jgi:hypothetical protein
VQGIVAEQTLKAAQNADAGLLEHAVVLVTAPLVAFGRE